MEEGQHHHFKAKDSHAFHVYKIHRIAFCECNEELQTALSEASKVNKSVCASHPLYDECIILDSDTQYSFEVDSRNQRPYLVGKLLQSPIDSDLQQPTSGLTRRRMPRTEDVIGCCEAAMRLLDRTIRDYIVNPFQCRTLASTGRQARCDVPEMWRD